MAVSLERLARNQVLFREVNERLVELSQGFDHGPIEFVCECSNDDCIETVAVPPGDYGRVRAHSRTFLILPGHEIPEIERVVETQEQFAIVEKFVDPAPTTSGA